MKHVRFWKQKDKEWKRQEFLGVIPKEGFTVQSKKKPKKYIANLQFEQNTSSNSHNKDGSRLSKSISRHEITRQLSPNRIGHFGADSEQEVYASSFSAKRKSLGKSQCKTPVDVDSQNLRRPWYLPKTQESVKLKDAP